MGIKRFDSEKVIGVLLQEQGGNGETRVELRDTETGGTRWISIDQGVGQEALEGLVQIAERNKAKREAREAAEAARLEAERKAADQKALEDAARLEAERAEATKLELADLAQKNPGKLPAEEGDEQ
ncbi:MAG: hypothetical protein HC933_10315 [Pleurocapsa sp. SU_196_0]|nr:hypothetical protein [Pleurocapsa sp. SU_196_0]